MKTRKQSIIKSILKLYTPLLTVLFCAAPFASQAALDLVGLDISVGNVNKMHPRDAAGAPGVRQTNWNNIIGVANSQNVVTLPAGSVTNRWGNVVPGMSVTVDGGDNNWLQRSGGGTNDPKMICDVIDKFNVKPAVVSVTGIPYAKYNVYFYYRANDAGFGAENKIEGGWFAITNSADSSIMMRYVKTLDSNYQLLPAVDSSGNNYRLSSTKAIAPIDSYSSIEQGNYVEFTGLTSSDFTALVNSFGANGNADHRDILGNYLTNGSGSTRLKFSGLQIEQVSTATLTNVQWSASLPLLLAGTTNSYSVGAVWGEYDDGNSNSLYLPDLSFVSSDPNVLAVSNTGRIQPRHAGTTDLTISYQGLSVTRSLSVLAPTLVWPTISPSTLYVITNAGIGDSIRAKIFANFPGVNNVDVTAFNYIQFGNVSPEVVSVTSAGLVTAIWPGTFDLALTYDGVAGASNNIGTVVAFELPSSIPSGISVKLTDATHGMTYHDYAGAPGVRLPYWNNLVLSGQNVSNMLTDPWDSKGNRLTDVAVIFTGGSTANPGIATVGTPTTNESVMFNTYYNAGINSPNNTPGSDRSIVISNIPYSSYDAYFYVNNDAANLNYPGHFQINGVDKYIKNFSGAGVPNSDGSGYVLAVQQPNFDYYLHTVSGGHYVMFSGLTDPNLTVTYGPMQTDMVGDAAALPRLRIAGLQIVSSIGGLTPTNMYLSVPVPGLLPGNPVGYPLTVLADFAVGIIGGNITLLPGITFASSDESKFVVDGGGVITALSPGNANLVIDYNGLSITQTVSCLEATSVKVSAVPSAEYLEREIGLVPAQASIYASFPGYTNVNITSFAGAAFIDQGSPVGSVDSAGVISPNAVKGSMAIGAIYQGVTRLTPDVFAVRSTNDPVVWKHRYSFREAPGSTIVKDSLGGADGTVVPPLETGLPIVLDGETINFPNNVKNVEPYVSLPPGIISSKGNVTIELWCGSRAIKSGGPFFAAGSTTKGLDPRNVGTPGGFAYLEFLNSAGATGDLPYPTVLNENFPGTSGQVLYLKGAALLGLNIGGVRQQMPETHFYIVKAPDAGFVKIYTNGVLATNYVEITRNAPLTGLNETVVWLGAALWNDAPLCGWINELRIGEGIPTDAAVAASYAAGADTGIASSITNIYLASAVPTLLPGNPATYQLGVFADFTNGVTASNITALAGLAYKSSDTNIFSVSATGIVTPGLTNGSASLIVTYDLTSSTQSVTSIAPTSVQVLVSPAVENNAATLTNATASLVGTFAGYGAVDMSLFRGIRFLDLGSPVATVSSSGTVAPTGVLGSMSVSAVYLGVTYIGTDVFSVVTTSKPNMSAVVAGNMLQLSWPEAYLGWKLQMQVTTLSQGLGTDWVDVPGTDSITSTNITVDQINGAVFYRMVNPR